jgi:hypothetical protein
MTSARISPVWGTILLTITIFSLSLPAYAKYSGGTGDANDPYQIATAEDLMLLGETPDDCDKHFILTADIDLDPNLPGRKVFDRAVINHFTGTFDGGGHTISHLTNKSGWVGLFGALASNAEVRKLGMVDVDITGSERVGGLACSNWGSVSECYSTGCVTGQWYVGGLVGINNGSVSRCHSRSSVSGFESVGGLVGHNSGIMSECDSTGVVGGNSYVGGLVGGNGGSVVSSYTACHVTGDSYVGGLVGSNGGEVRECYPGTIRNCYSRSVVIGADYVGGVAGYVLGDVTQCYSAGTVTGATQNIGGLVGACVECECGYIMGPTWVLYGVTEACFWDTQTSTQAESDGGTGLVTDEMQTASTFLDAGWDFVGETVNGTEDIWKISEGLDYPRLWWEKYSGGTGDPNDPYQIATAADLIALGEDPNDYDKNFVLIADIDLDPNLPGCKVFDRAVVAPYTNDVTRWFEGTAFTGVFDGNGHTISNLTIAGGSYLGLFGFLEGGWWQSPACLVKNLGVVDVSITGTGDQVGGLVGYNSGGTVTQCYSSGVVSGNSWVGGLVGMESTPWFGGRTIMDCYSTAAVFAATGGAGGLVGYNDGTILRCYSAGPVAAVSGAGGLVGVSGEDSGSVTECFWDIEMSRQATSAGGTGKTTLEMYSPGTFVAWGACGSPWTIDDGLDYPRLVWENAPGEIIAGPTYAGGAGTAEEPYIITTAEHLITLGLCSCNWDKYFILADDIDLSTLTLTGSVVPSFSGVFDGNGHIISNLTITGGDSLGLFGYLAPGASVRNLGIVEVNIAGSGVYVGGLAGNNGGVVTQCYSTGFVSGNEHVGGLVGTNGGDVSWCYSTCGVSGDRYVGGLVGYNSGGMVHCYAAGSVLGNIFVGGLAGDGYPGGAMHCVWDVQTSGLSGSAGGVGLTTDEMMNPNMLGINGFANDPNWVLDAGSEYPRLAWEGTTGILIIEPSVDWLEGQGTADEPYRIDVADQLILLGKASALWDKHFVLGADIDLDPNLPGRGVFDQALVSVFSGVFDGDGHAISNLTIRGKNYLGLFGWIDDPNSEVRNLSLIDPNVAGGNYVGALAGWIENGMVANCRVVDPNVFGTSQAGGLTASHQNGTITDCSVLGGRVSSTWQAGGLVGNGDRIIRCSVQQVEVISTGEFFTSVGGLTVTAEEIVDCQVKGGLVRGLSKVGGLAGFMSGGTISGCCTSTCVESAGEGFSLDLNMGGLVGENNATIENCYSTSSVTQTDPNNLWALMPSGAGGLVGWNHGTIRFSYSTGAVVASEGSEEDNLFGVILFVGGLTGLDWGGDSNIEGSFWNTETSGQAISANGVGKTTAEMQTAGTFLDAGWDFAGETVNGTEDIWWILEGQDYPRLWWETE